jgi:undecaprenyl-diphosphatase
MQKTTSSTSATVVRTQANPILLVIAGLLLLAGLIWTIPTTNDWWKVIILGIVEGITEFLPISSTGHLLIASNLLRFEGSIGGTFEIFIQLGAVIAVIGFYFRDLWHQVRTVPSDPNIQRFWLGILLAFIPAAVVGLAFRDFIKEVLFSPTVIAWALIIGGIALIIIERAPRRPPTTTEVTNMTLRQAISIGAAQILALIPGVSRSGASIIGGMLSGLDRRSATAFSFYLSIPTLGAATVVDLLASLDQVGSDDLGRLFLGAVVAMIVAWISIEWLLRYVSSRSFVAFGVYRIIAGVVILILIALGQLQA